MHYNESVDPNTDIGVHCAVNSSMCSETTMKRTGNISYVAVFHTLLIAGGALAGSDAPRTIELRPRLAEGDAFYVEWESTTKSIWTRKGALGCWIRRTHDRFGFILRVEDIQPDGAARVKLTYDRMACAGWWGDGTEDGDAWDSDTDPPDAPSKLRTVLQPVLGATLTMEVDRAGRITSFIGLGALRRKVEQSDPGQDTLKWVDSFLNVKAQRCFWERWLGMYAFRSVARGDQWNRSVSSVIYDHAVTYSLDRINTYEDHVRATVHFKGRGIPHADAKTDEIADGVTWEYGEYSYVGRSTFDSRLGLIVRGRVEGRDLLYRVGRNPESGEEERYQIRRTANVKLTALTLDERQAQKRCSAAGAIQP